MPNGVLTIEDLRLEIPKYLSKFKQLKNEKKGYDYKTWGKECPIIHFYVNDAHTQNKRIFANEIIDLWDKCKNEREYITRDDYREHCPKTSGEGKSISNPCGFAVLIRILQHRELITVLDKKENPRRRYKINKITFSC